MNNDIETKYSIAPFFKAYHDTLHKKIGAKEKPLILFQGGFGKHNTGDDTLLLVAMRETRLAYPEAQLIALCHNPVLLKNDYGIDGVKFKSFKTFSLLFKADALVAPAGGLTNNIDFSSKLKSLLNPRGKFILIALLITIIRGKCTVLFGVGIHDIPDNIVKILLQLTIPRVTLLGVRDKHTVQYVSSLGRTDYFFSHDPVISYKGHDSVNKQDIPYDHYIVINFRLVKDTRQSEKAINEFVEYLNAFYMEHKEYGIVFLPFSIHPSFKLENDLEAFKKILKHPQLNIDSSKIMLIEKYQSAYDVRKIASKADLLILTRHHAPVITYMCQKPTIVVSYNYKCREFAELGEYKYIIDYSKLNSNYLMEVTRKELSYEK